MEETVDAIVIGMGPGGEEVAGGLADAGLNVIGIEERLVGGECPYFACVPTKMMVRAADLLAEARRVGAMAGTAAVTPGWTPVATRIREEATDGWDDRVAVERFERKGGHFVRGSGRFEGPNIVAAGDRRFSATRAVVINTGTAPAIPPIDGLRDVPHLTNRDVARLTHIPDSIAVLGGGPVGMELAQVLRRFGSRVTVIEAGTACLVHEEPEASALIGDVFRREGIDIRSGVPARQVRQAEGGVEIVLDDGATVAARSVLVATGRALNLPPLQLRNAGLQVDERAPLPVDDRLRVTGADRIWAVGDVTGKGAFTHVSMYQARIALDDILGRDGGTADYRALPRVTFTDPEVGSVGLTEREARERGLTVRVGMASVPRTARGWIHKEGNDGFIKLVEDADRGTLVGATSVGPVGGEVLSMLIVAVHAAVPVAALRSMITAYPTFHRGIEDALHTLH